MTDVETDGVQDHVFGYTLVSDWVAKDASGDPLGTSEGVPLSIGPCVVTRRRSANPQSMFLQAKVEGEEMAKGNLNGAARSLFAMIAAASRGTTLERADAFALGPFPAQDDDPGRPVVARGDGGARRRGDRIPRNRLGARP